VIFSKYDLIICIVGRKEVSVRWMEGSGRSCRGTRLCKKCGWGAKSVQLCNVSWL